MPLDELCKACSVCWRMSGANLKSQGLREKLQQLTAFGRPCLTWRSQLLLTRAFIS